MITRRWRRATRVVFAGSVAAAALLLGDTPVAPATRPTRVAAGTSVRISQAVAAARSVRMSHAVAAARSIPISEAVGQMIIAPMTVGSGYPPGLLADIRGGRVGGVILFGSHLSASQVRDTVSRLQGQARAGHKPGLLILTDQEGGEVLRLAGPPALSAQQMSNPTVAKRQGIAAGKLLRSAGVNVDLAPVADVARQAAGFIALQHRSFGTNPAVVSGAACAFADGLARSGVAYTLKHFPGLGSAIQSTDNGAAPVTESAGLIYADDAAYRACGHGPLALVMLSNASYSHLTGATPAVMSPTTYRSLLPRSHVSAVTISDSLDAAALARQFHPGLRAVEAGLNLLLYTGAESQVEQAYTGLTAYSRNGVLSPRVVQRAAAAILALKKALRIST